MKHLPLAYSNCINNTKRLCVYILVLTLIFIFAFINSALSQNTIPVLFSGPKERVPYKIYFDGVFIGRMGDAINAPLGQHVVAIEGPYGARLFLKFDFGVGWINNIYSQLAQPSCWDKREYVKTWHWHYEPLPNKTIVHIHQPVIGVRSKISPCMRPRLKIFRHIGKIEMRFKIKPEKSTILIDGKRSGRTPNKIGVFYYENTKSITVVVSKEGYINFTEQLRPPFPDEKIYDFVLNPF